MKVSAVAPERHVIEAKARVFNDQGAVKAAFQAGEIYRGHDRRRPLSGTARKRNAGTPWADALLAVLQDRGLKVALVTDGRMSGASGKVPSAIHVCPEAWMAARLPRYPTATSCASMRWPERSTS